MIIEIRVVSVKGAMFTGQYPTLPSRAEVKVDIDKQNQTEISKVLLNDVIDGVLVWPRIGAKLGFTRSVIVDGRRVGFVTFTTLRSNILRD